MKPLAAALAVAAAAMLATQAFAAATLTFDFAYAGSANTTLTSSQVISGLGITSNPNLSSVDYTSPSYQNASWRHYFDLTVQFNPDGDNQALRGFIGSINLTSNLTAITPAGASGGTTQKFFPFNPNVDGAVGSPPINYTTAWFLPGDAGTAGDLQAIAFVNSDAAIARTTQVGVGGGGPVTGEGVTSLAFNAPTAVGRFAIGFDAPLTQTASITATASPGQWFSYFNGTTDTSFSTIAPPYAPNGIDIEPAFQPFFRSFSIAAAVAPEPASLTALLPAAALLLARRRR